MPKETEDLSIDVEVAEDSILAHKKVTVRSMKTAKLKHMRAAQRAFKAGNDADVEDLIVALSGLLIGWTEDEVAELTLEEMTPIMAAINAQQRGAIPNGSATSSRRPSPVVRRRSVRTG